MAKKQDLNKSEQNLDMAPMGNLEHGRYGEKFSMEGMAN